MSHRTVTIFDNKELFEHQRSINDERKDYIIGSPGASIKVYGKSDLIKMYGKEKAIQIIKTAEKSFNENLNNSLGEDSN